MPTRWRRWRSAGAAPVPRTSWQLLRNRALDGMETLEGCHGSAMVRLLRLLEAPDPVGSERGAEIFGGASERRWLRGDAELLVSTLAAT